MPIKIDHCYLLTHKININSSAGWQKSFHIIIVNRVRLGHVRGSGSARNELYTFPLWRIFPEIKVHLSSFQRCPFTWLPTQKLKLQLNELSRSEAPVPLPEPVHKDPLRRLLLWGQSMREEKLQMHFSCRLPTTD
jgi:hypothetical protein